MKKIIFILLILLITGCNAQTQKTNIDNSLDNAINLIKQGNYADISPDLLNNKNIQSNAVFNYAQAKKSEQDGFSPEGWLIDISNNYNGVFAKEINQMKLKYKNKLNELKRKREEETYTPDTEYGSQPEIKSNPSIGMTPEEVKNSSWGKPNHINKTTTANTIHEQWVYSNNRYIYLDNGKVTAIQN